MSGGVCFIFIFLPLSSDPYARAGILGWSVFQCVYIPMRFLSADEHNDLIFKSTYEINSA